jgi:hypothetical protein
MALELGTAPPMAEVEQKMRQHLAALFEMQIVPA